MLHTFQYPLLTGIKTTFRNLFMDLQPFTYECIQHIVYKPASHHRWTTDIFHGFYYLLPQID